LGILAKTVNRALALALLALLQSSAASWAEGYGFSPVSGQVTSDYGWRTDPMTGGPRFHGGIDIAAAQGTPVYAPQSGMVIYSGAYGGYGNVVVLNHGNTLFTVYGHNSKLLVQPGDRVYRGQVISLVGSTGRSTGPHLHFEVHYKQQYLNPVSYLVYVQHTEGMLAQASSQRVVAPQDAVAAYNGSARTAPPSPVRERHVGLRGHGAQSVQLLNGGNEEMVEF
jgi:murein DD-endopeptidase MepM/ murein hydrolase activator NlpD